MNFLFNKLDSKAVESKGQRFYMIGKFGMLIGACGIALMLVIGLISLAAGARFFDALSFDLLSSASFAYLFVVIDYLALLCGFIGVPCYFYGINLFALGRIACNTEKE